MPHPKLQPTDAGKRRRPTGISSDRLTLFFFDESANLERAAWRDAPEAPFHVAAVRHPKASIAECIALSAPGNARRGSA